MPVIYRVMLDSIKVQYIDDPVLSNLAKTITNKVAIFGQRSYSGWPIGLEKAVISLLQSGKSRRLNYSKLDQYRATSSSCPGINNILMRPDSELAAKYLWSRPDGIVKTEDLVTLNRILGGSPNPKIRRMPCRVFDRDNDWKLFYLEPDLVHETLEEWIVRYQNTKNSIVEEIVTLLQFLLIHPFMDGNGRLSRLLLQHKLAEHGFTNYPLLPVGPVLRCEMSRFSRSMRDWAVGGSILPPLGILLEALNDTADLVTELLSGD